MPLFFTALFLSVSFAANGADIFHYSILRYPGAECAQTHDEISKKLSQDFNVTLYSVKCAEEGKIGLNLDISYVAEAPLPLVSTYEDDYTIYSQSSNSNRAECEKALPVEKDLFYRNMGIQPFLAYCFLDPRPRMPEYPYAIRIDGFGTPKARFRISGFIIDNLLTDFNSLSEQVEASMYLAGDRVATIRYSHKSSEILNFFTIRHYTTRSGFLTSKSIGKIKPLAACEAERARLVSVPKKYPNFIHAFFCDRGKYSSDISFNVGYFDPVSPSTPTKRVTFSTAPDTYKSLLACDLDRSRIDQFYRETLKKEVMFVACVQVANEFYAQVGWLKPKP